MATRSGHRKGFSLFAFQDIITSVTGVILLVMLLLTLELIQRRTVTLVPLPSSEAGDLRAQAELLDQQLEQAQKELSKNAESVDRLSALTPSEMGDYRRRLRQETRRLEEVLKRLQEQLQGNQLAKEILTAATASSQGAERELEETRNELAKLEEQLKSLEESNRIIFNPNALSRKRAWLVDITSDIVLVAEVGREAAPLRFAEAREQERIMSFFDWANTRSAVSEYFVLMVRPGSIEPYQEVRKGLEDRGFDLGFDLLGDNDTVIDPLTGAGYEE